MRQRMLQSGREVPAAHRDDDSAAILASLAAAKAAGVPGSLGGRTTRAKLSLGAAFAGMTVTGQISGGRRLVGWRSLSATDSAYARIPPELRAATWVCDLAANGLISTGTATRRVNSQTVTAATLRLFQADRAIPEARYPASGWLQSAANPAPNQMTLAAGFPTPANWAGARLYGFPVYDYRGESLPVLSCSGSTATFGHTYSGSDATAYAARTSRYALVGEPEWLTPGTWWADPAGLKVYYVCGDGPGEVWCDVLEDAIVEVVGSGITFREAVVAHGRKQGIDVTSTATSTRICRSEIHSVERGIQVSSQATIEDCHVHDFGADGVVILPTGDRASLTPSGITVDGNEIERHMEPLTNGGIHAYATSGAGSKGVGYSIRNNHLHDLTGAGIVVAGNDHAIEGNTVEDVATDVDDFPGIYVGGRDYTLRGTRIEGNTLKRVFNRIGTSAPVHAIYLDDCASGVRVANNRLIDVQVAMFFGGGRDNVFVGNYTRLKDGGSLLRCDSRAASWSPWTLEAQVEPTEGEWAVRARLDLFNVGSGLWAARYPALAAMSTAGNSHRVPNGNVMVANGVWNGVGWVRNLAGLVERTPSDLAGADFVPQSEGSPGPVPLE